MIKTPSVRHGVFENIYSTLTIDDRSLYNVQRQDDALARGVVDAMGRERCCMVPEGNYSKLDVCSEWPMISHIKAPLKLIVKHYSKE